MSASTETLREYRVKHRPRVQIGRSSNGYLVAREFPMRPQMAERPGPSLF